VKRKQPIGVARVLPPDAARMLIDASCVERSTRQPLARVKAIDAAVKRIKEMYPQFFRQEN
jgi:hypothetical protein